MSILLWHLCSILSKDLFSLWSWIGLNACQSHRSLPVGAFPPIGPAPSCPCGLLFRFTGRNESCLFQPFWREGLLADCMEAQIELDMELGTCTPAPDVWDQCCHPVVELRLSQADPCLCWSLHFGHVPLPVCNVSCSAHTGHPNGIQCLGLMATFITPKICSGLLCTGSCRLGVALCKALAMHAACSHKFAVIALGHHLFACISAVLASSCGSTLLLAKPFW